MERSAKVLLGAAGLLAGLFILGSASAAETHVKVEDAPKTVVDALSRASFQEVRSPVASIAAVLAVTGVEDGEPTALGWARGEQARGMVVLVSRDVLSTIDEGTVLLSMTREAAAVLLQNLTTYYQLPAV